MYFITRDVTHDAFMHANDVFIVQLESRNNLTYVNMFTNIIRILKNYLISFHNIYM